MSHRKQVMLRVFLLISRRKIYSYEQNWKNQRQHAWTRRGMNIENRKGKNGSTKKKYQKNVQITDCDISCIFYDMGKLRVFAVCFHEQTTSSKTNIILTWTDNSSHFTKIPTTLNINLPKTTCTFPRIIVEIFSTRAPAH